MKTCHFHSTILPVAYQIYGTTTFLLAQSLIIFQLLKIFTHCFPSSWVCPRLQSQAGVSVFFPSGFLDYVIFSWEETVSLPAGRKCPVTLLCKIKTVFQLTPHFLSSTSENIIKKKRKKSGSKPNITVLSLNTQSTLEPNPPLSYLKMGG